MSVVKSKRGQSSVEFLDTAHKIQQETLRIVIKYIPKRYTFYVSQKIVGHATDGCSLVKQGNSIYASTKEDVVLRREYFMRAYAEYQALVSQITSAHEMFHFPDETMVRWMELISRELKVLKAVMQSDRARFKAFID